ncbi:hypothetical protein JJD41_02180 [Oxynema sp. CENA135]|uniref:hypothetical protein n=1 Tax=Oxynema sp. CENA135 TaxID=984206 RepID=UPI00190D30F3|nr:hypothetical protein [Oxynema sp. CENA135]MBK4728698.1 hypothetical protein [Oxynema sp. CENA135]
MGSTLFPKLLGTYEIELHKLVENLGNQRFGKIIDVGAAEGYYAVGFSLISPVSNILAFEMESKGRELLSAMASLNGVANRVSVEGKCDLNNFATALAEFESALVVMDVEGFESELLNPDAVPQLRQCHVLVEVHDYDYVVREIGDLIKKRFLNTHTIQLVPVKERQIADAPGLLKRLQFYPFDAWVLSSLNECRPLSMYWLYLKPFDSLLLQSSK